MCISQGPASESPARTAAWLFNLAGRLTRLGAALAVAAGVAGCQAPDDDAVAVVISLPDQYVAGAAQATVLVDYSSTGARLVHEGSGPACAFILPGFKGDFSDDGRGTLTIRTRGGRSLRGPADIAACRMDAGEGATAAGIARKLQVEISAAEDAEGKALDVVTSGSASRRSGGSGGSDPVDVEEAQRAAVRAAVSQAPTRVASAPTASPEVAKSPTAPSPSAAGPSRPAAIPTPGAAAAAAAAAARKAAGASRDPAQGVVRPPVGGSQADAPSPVDDGPIPLEDDADPGYDDSPADDESVAAYTLEFSVLGSQSYGALQLEVNHLGRSGGFIGRGDAVDCVSLVEALVASNYLGERVVKIGLISLQGIPASGPIMRCGFRTRESLSPASFRILVADASDTDSVQIDPPPTVVISTISPR